MDRKATVVFLLAVATATAGVVPVPKVLEGPSSKTTIIGPDGSKISAFAPGGKILLEENAGPVLQGAPEVVAVAGVAQPLPVTPEVVGVPEVAQPLPVAPSQSDAVIPVVEIISEEDSLAVEEESVPVAVPVEVGEPTDIARSAITANSIEVETTIVPATASTVQELQESQTESVESLEGDTDSAVVEKVTETPFSVVPLVKNVDPVAAEAQPLVGYINNSPFYVPQFQGLEGEYVPENLYEQEILGW